MGEAPEAVKKVPLLGDYEEVEILLFLGVKSLRGLRYRGLPKNFSLQSGKLIFEYALLMILAVSIPVWRQ